MTGICLIALAAVMEAAWLAREPWTMALITLDSDPAETIPANALAVRMRVVARETPAPGDKLLEKLQAGLQDELIGTTRMDTPEEAFAVAMPAGDVAPLLASGRLPLPGAREALAGDLARDQAFRLGEEEFTVVGRLKPAVSVFLFAYLILDESSLDKAFPDDGETHEGWLDPKGLETFAPAMATEEDDKGESDRVKAATPIYVGGQCRTKPALMVWTIVGMLLAALGGALTHNWFCRKWACNSPEGFFTPLFREIIHHPRLWAGVHLGLYGAFFLAMFAAWEDPLLAYRLTAYIGMVFSEGELDYIGQAYASGNVLWAALATFQNNYLVQTVVLTYLVSLFGLPFGLIKNALSFGMAGLVMAPLWTNAAQGYVFHVVTMMLEFEAYTLACFVIMAWPMRLLEALRAGGADGVGHLIAGVRSLGGGILATGVMLAVAALYEAVTLISMM